jgi:DNA replication protein DnaC
MGTALDVQTISRRMESLGLGFMSAGLESFLSDQSHADLPLTEAIARLIELEYIPRKERAARTRLKLSGMPQVKLLADFELSWLKGGLTQRKFSELSSLAFIQRKENIVLLGPSGIGKTHLLLGLGHKACLGGYSAYYLSCMDAIEQLLKAKEQNRLKRKLKWFCKPNLLLLDEIGYENLDPEQAHVFFQLVNVRYEVGSMILTSNRPFGQWAELMGDDAVATATLDRVLHHAHVLSLQGDSYRMKDRLKLGVVDFG